jgi:hypothetical protein
MEKIMRTPRPLPIGLESVSRIPSFIINAAHQYSRRTHNDSIAKLAADKDFSEFDNLGARASPWSTLCFR